MPRLRDKLWKDLPNETTPITAEDMNFIEEHLYNSFEPFRFVQATFNPDATVTYDQVLEMEKKSGLELSFDNCTNIKSLRPGDFAVVLANVSDMNDMRVMILIEVRQLLLHKVTGEARLCIQSGLDGVSPTISVRKGGFNLLDDSDIIWFTGGIFEVDPDAPYLKGSYNGAIQNGVYTFSVNGIPYEDLYQDIPTTFTMEIGKSYRFALVGEGNIGAVGAFRNGSEIQRCENNNVSGLIFCTSEANKELTFKWILPANYNFDPSSGNFKIIVESPDDARSATVITIRDAHQTTSAYIYDGEITRNELAESVQAIDQKILAEHAYADNKNIVTKSALATFDNVPNVSTTVRLSRSSMGEMQHAKAVYVAPYHLMSNAEFKAMGKAGPILTDITGDDNDNILTFSFKGKTPTGYFRMQVIALYQGDPSW